LRSASSENRSYQPFWRFAFKLAGFIAKKGFAEKN